MAYLGTRLKPDAKLNWRDRSYQYLQQSQIPTYRFQNSLPNLPVPPLSDTCQRYLASLAPLLKQEELKEVEKIVQNFLKYDGIGLQQALEEDAMKNSHTSYISKHWFDMYLRTREPLVPHSNTGITLIHDSRTEMHLDSIQRPVNILISALRFYRSLKEQILLPEVYHSKPSKSDVPEFWERIRNASDSEATQLSWLWGAFPLDMSQFEHLYATARLPGEEKDIIQWFPNTKHIIVIRGGQLFTFDALTSNGELFPPSYYQDAFVQIMSDQPPVKSQHDIAALTTEDRVKWAKLRDHLSSLSEENEFGLRQIDSALLCVCLDEHWEQDLNDDLSAIVNVTMGENPSNRWCDKSFNVVFSKNGACGLHMEHAWGDGLTINRFTHDIISDSQKHHFVEEIEDEALHSHPNIKRIEFTVDDIIAKAVQHAKAAHHARTSTLQFKAIYVNGVGIAECNKAGISPDSLMQSGFHLAFYRLHGHLTSTYESCSTGIYKHGRTETIRSCTAEVEHMVKTFTSKIATTREKLQALKACSKKHKELIRCASQGLGWDRHLFALQLTALEKGHGAELFSHPSYALATSNGISSSTTRTDWIINGSFAPPDENGYGIVYRIAKGLEVCLSAFNTKQADIQGFSEAIETSLQDLRAVLLSDNKL